MSSNYLDTIKNLEKNSTDAETIEAEKPSYLNIIRSKTSEKELPELNKFQQYLAAPTKGALRELGNQLRNLPLLQETLGDTGLLMSDEQGEELLNKLSPQPEDAISKSLERGGRIGLYAALGGQAAAQQAIPRSIAGGAIGQGLEELGAPPWLQSIGEASPFVFPAFRQIIDPTKGQEAKVSFLRRMGLSEKEIAPAIQGERKQRFLTKLIPKRGRTARALKQTRQALGNVYNQLRARPEAQQLMSPQQVNSFASEVAAVTQNWPAHLRDVIRQDAADLARAGFNGDNLINFWQDLSYAHKLGHERVGTLKGAITNALDSLSPELGKDFRMTNDIYGNFSNLSARLKPGLASDILNGVARFLRGGRVLYGFLHGNYPVMLEALGEEGAKHLSREMLINPRFQNLGKQMVTALNENRIPIFERLVKSFSDILEPIDKEAAKELEENQFKNLIKSTRQESDKEKRKQPQK